MTKLKRRTANCDKVFANASNKLRHEKQANHRNNSAKHCVPNFDKEKVLLLLTYNYFFVKLAR